MSHNADVTANEDAPKREQGKNLDTNEPHNIADFNDIIENVSSEMIGYVSENPNYVQCLLHIKAYRDYHRGEKEEFNERIEVLDERYKKYNMIIDSMQIMIIVFSAGAAFVQGGNSLFKISDNVLRFIGLCVSSWTALVLSVAKYYKLDEQKEGMNNLRQQCSDLVSELGAREDRLNTLCAKEIWAGPPGAPPPPAVTAWENERDEMYNSLKTMIQKKQSLVAVFDQIMDTEESKKLILASKSKSLFYKKEKLKLDKLFLDYAVDRNKHNDIKMRLDGRKHTRKIADMSKMQPTGMFNVQSVAPTSQMHYFYPQQRRMEEPPSLNEQYYQSVAKEVERCAHEREAVMTKHIIELREQNNALQDKMSVPRDEETGHAGILKTAGVSNEIIDYCPDPDNEDELNECFKRVDELYTKEEQAQAKKLSAKDRYRARQQDRQRIENEVAVDQEMSNEDKQKRLYYAKLVYPTKEESSIYEEWKKNDNAKTETNDNAKTETNDNAKTETNDNAKTETNDNAKTETNDNAKTETKDDAKTETKDDAETETKLPVEDKNIIVENSNNMDSPDYESKV